MTGTTELQPDTHEDRLWERLKLKGESFTPEADRHIRHILGKPTCNGVAWEMRCSCGANWFLPRLSLVATVATAHGGQVPTP